MAAKVHVEAPVCTVEVRGIQLISGEEVVPSVTTAAVGRVAPTMEITGEVVVSIEAWTGLVGGKADHCTVIERPVERLYRV